MVCSLRFIVNVYCGLSQVENCVDSSKIVINKILGNNYNCIRIMKVHSGVNGIFA